MSGEKRFDFAWWGPVFLYFLAVFCRCQWALVVSGLPAQGGGDLGCDLFEHLQDSFEGWMDGVELEDEVGGVGQDTVGAEAGGDFCGCAVGDMHTLAEAFRG